MSDRTARLAEVALPALVIGPWVVIGWWRLFELSSALFF
jgi:hypothetical protein